MKLGDMPKHPNCIILYNSVILSRLLEHRQATGDKDGIEQLKKISPVAWQHINMHGRYEFKRNVGQLRIDDIVQQMIQAGTVFKPSK